MITGNSGVKTDFDVIIIGGGLAGLIHAILLSRNKKRVLLIEKKIYPFHKVCGEYVSNEVLPFLQSLGFDPFSYGASCISKLRISTPTGKNIYTSLDLGGFGLSRYVLDNALYELSLKSGTEVLTDTKVTDVKFKNNYFEVQTNHGNIFTSKFVTGCYGKRDILDKKLKRNFMDVHTGYLGVKYHIKIDYPFDEIGLDNFEDGYCGISKIEDDKYNLCYLYKRNKGFDFKNIGELQENILFRNPFLKNIFFNSEILFSQPEVINEFSFVQKSLIENHIIMCGDTAGLITPLCGNGMSMAIHSAKILSQLMLNSGVLDSSEISMDERILLETGYKQTWKNNFSNRLFWGRTIQKLFGNKTITELSISSIHAVPALEKWLISSTHGNATGV